MKLKGNNFEPMRVPFHIKVILLLGILVAVPIIIMYSRSMRYFDSKNRELFDSIDIFDQTWFKSRAKRSIEAKECLQVEKQTNNQHRFEDLMTSSVKPKPDSTIFFHVTSCPKDGLIALTTRNVCTLESVAKSNPNRQIFVIFSSPTGFGFENNSSPIIEALQDYRNIHFRNVNWQKYAKDTPIEDWMQENHLLSSMHFQAHLSNYLRLITLYRFGGIHFDFDFIFHKRLDDLQPNFVSEERKDVLSNGAIAFESKDTGHEIVDMILRESAANYDPLCQVCTGWIAIHHVQQKVCKQTPKPDQLNAQKCRALNVVPHHTFFPIRNWKQVLETNATAVEETLKVMNNSIAMNMCSKATSQQKIVKSAEPKSVLLLMAEQHCPMVLQASGEHF